MLKQKEPPQVPVSLQIELDVEGGPYLMADEESIGQLTSDDEGLCFECELELAGNVSRLMFPFGSGQEQVIWSPSTFSTILGMADSRC